jgi:hypothetical protein
MMLWAASALVVLLVGSFVWAAVNRYWRVRRWQEFDEVTDEYARVSGEREKSGGREAGVRERQLQAYLHRVNSLATVYPRGDWPLKQWPRLPKG